MIILALRKIIDFENSAKDGRMPCTLLPTKGIKTPVKLIQTQICIEKWSLFLQNLNHLLVLNASQFLLFSPKYFSNPRLIKTISIETP